VRTSTRGQLRSSPPKPSCGLPPCRSACFAHGRRRPHSLVRVLLHSRSPKPRPRPCWATPLCETGAAPPISSPLGLTTARWSRPECPLGRSMVAPAALFPRVQPNGLPPARVVQRAQRVARLSARLRSPRKRPCGSSRRRHRRRISRSLHALARYGVRCYAAGRVLRENLPKPAIHAVPAAMPAVASAHWGSSLRETATRGLPPDSAACCAHGRKSALIATAMLAARDGRRGDTPTPPPGLRPDAAAQANRRATRTIAVVPLPAYGRQRDADHGRLTADRLPAGAMERA
jgi:hypothetical protein